MKIFTTILTLILTICSLNASTLAKSPSPKSTGESFTTVACNGFEYCPSAGQFFDSEWIESVEFGTINNVSGIDNGYGDFTNFSTDVIPGGVYPITCTPGLTFDFQEFFRVWIDFNQNGELEDTELVFDPGGSSDPQTGDITIPFDAIPGSTLMRVAMKFGDVSVPCEALFTFGEVEDYCVNVINADFCYNPFVQVLDISDEGATLDWNPVDLAVGYDLRYREVGMTTWTEFYLFEDSLILTGLEDCAEYEFQIRSDCDSTMIDYSNIYTFETYGCGACIDFDYCLFNSPPATFLEFINAVSIADLDNVSGDNQGYFDFGSSFTTTLNNDSTYTLSLEAGYPFFEYDSQWFVWIDYNQDGDFDEANELAYESEIMNDVLTEVDITIPADAGIGLTKMRIKFEAFGGAADPCIDFYDGEMEDYCVTIQPIVLPCGIPENLDTSNITTFSIDMHWEIDEFEIGVGYVIRYKPVSSNDWKEISSVEPTYTPFDLEECTDYEYQVRTVCPQELSEYSESFLFTSACLTSIVEEPFEATEDIANVLVFPNPFKDQINMNLYLQKSGDINIQLFDISGKMLLAQNHQNLNTGEHQFLFNTNAPLASGMYFLRIATENSVVTEKLIRQ